MGRTTEESSNMVKLSHSTSLQILSVNKETLKLPGEIEKPDEKQRIGPKIRTYSDSDIDDILNYENSDEIAQYEKQLRNQYYLEESDSSQESIHQEENKKTDSFANLMNILTVMRKTNLSKSVSNSKSSLFENMNKKKISGSQVDMPELKGINQSIKNVYKNETKTIKLEKETCENDISRKVKKSDKQNLWENILNKDKEFQTDKPSMIDIGKTERREADESTSMIRRTNSCRDISWGRVSSELDEETMVGISESKQMAKEMFESAAPKYKFGGSLSNVNISNKSSNKQNVQKINPVKEEFDERKWVLDSINKHFDVILEEEEDESDSAYDDSDGEEYWSESDEDTVEQAQHQAKKSSTAMQGLLKSVVSKIRTSCTNLNDKEVVSSLKTQLEHR